MCEKAVIKHPTAPQTLCYRITFMLENIDTPQSFVKRTAIARRRHLKQLLKKSSDVNIILFTDEKIFTVVTLKPRLHDTTGCRTD